METHELPIYLGPATEKLLEQNWQKRRKKKSKSLCNPPRSMIPHVWCILECVGDRMFQWLYWYARKKNRHGQHIQPTKILERDALSVSGHSLRIDYTDTRMMRPAPNETERKKERKSGRFDTHITYVWMDDIRDLVRVGEWYFIHNLNIGWEFTNSEY